MKRLLLFLFPLALVSCEKDELPVPTHVPGDVITSTVNMGQDYRWQIYFDLGTNRVVGQNLKSIWDLGFETSPAGYHVVLNTSKAMFALNTGNADISQVNDTAGFSAGKSWDEASGNFDSTAIGDWRATQPVYILDRGYNESGQHQGFRKLQLQSVNAWGYTIRFAQLNGSGDTTFFIPKDTTYNFTFLSFGNGGELVNVEPPKAEWDLVFTQYLHIFHDPVTPYLVTGCLLNRYATTAARDSLTAFSAIRYQQVSSYTLSPDVNTIGYDWKTFSGNTFTTNPGMNFIIRDQSGFFYKLHFTDFYDANGVKGNPEWEFRQL